MKIPIALVQFDAVPEQVDHNLDQMERLVRQAVGRGGRWVMFHEGTVQDYTGRLEELAEAVPEGKSTRRMEELAEALNCFISFGLSERNGDRFHIAQVFVGPRGYIYHHRKTWLYISPDYTDKGYRNEIDHYDPGTGPELFEIDGIRATCFICADGASRRCVQRAAALKPQVVFHPANMGGGQRGDPPKLTVEALANIKEHRLTSPQRARTIGAPILCTNRVGRSWGDPSNGGSMIFSAEGETLAEANSEGREEILRYDLEIK